MASSAGFARVGHTGQDLEQMIMAREGFEAYSPTLPEPCNLPENPEA